MSRRSAIFRGRRRVRMCWLSAPSGWSNGGGSCGPGRSSDWGGGGRISRTGSPCWRAPRASRYGWIRRMFRWCVARAERWSWRVCWSPWLPWWRSGDSEPASPKPRRRWGEGLAMCRRRGRRRLRGSSRAKEATSHPSNPRRLRIRRSPQTRRWRSGRKCSNRHGGWSGPWSRQRRRFRRRSSRGGGRWPGWARCMATTASGSSSRDRRCRLRACCGFARRPTSGCSSIMSIVGSNEVRHRGVCSW